MVSHPNEPPSDLIQSVSRALRILEVVGAEPNQLSVKSLARRSGLTLATTYHLTRTLAWTGYLTRTEDGTYTLGKAISRRYTQLRRAYADPPQLQTALRDCVRASGLSMYLAQIQHSGITVTMAVEGPLSPPCDELVPGFDEGAHALAFGWALLASLPRERRARYLTDHAMPRYTPNTITSTTGLDQALAIARNGLFVEQGHFDKDMASAAVVALPDERPDRRLAVGCTLPIGRIPYTRLRDLLNDAAHRIQEITTTGSTH